MTDPTPNPRRRSTIERAADLTAAGLPIGPRVHLCVCGGHRHEHGPGQARLHTGSLPERGCKRYRADLAYEYAYKALDAQATRLGQALRDADRKTRDKHVAANPRKPGEWSIGASDTSTCPRAIQYRNAPPEDFKPDWEDKREALAGQMLHDGIETRMRDLYPWREFERPVRIGGLDRASRLDYYDPITAEVGDYKTAGRWRWDKVGQDGVPESVWEQVMLYGLALEDEGLPVRSVAVHYYKRENGHDESFTRPYDRAVAEAARDRLLGYAADLDLGLELPRTGTGPTNDPLCKRCFARSDCWNIERAAQVRRSPESLTVLGEDPEFDAIVWAIGRKVEADTAARAAKAQVEEVKTLLDGVEPGRYGEYEGYEKRASTSGQVDWKAWAERLTEYMGLPDEMRPNVEDIPIPTRPASTYMQWGRVRKATLDRERREAAALDKGVA